MFHAIIVSFGHKSSSSVIVQGDSVYSAFASLLSAFDPFQPIDSFNILSN